MSNIKAIVYDITVGQPGNLWAQYEVHLHNGAKSICINSTPYKGRAEKLADQINKLLQEEVNDERND